MIDFILYGSFLLPTQPQAIVMKSTGSYNLRSPALKAVCQQMSSDHLADIAALNELNTDLRNLIGRADWINFSGEIESLVKQIAELSRRIRFIAKPEWNSEIIPAEIKWIIPYSFFFKASEWHELQNRGAVVDKVLLQSDFLGFNNKSVAKYFLFETPEWRSQFEEEHSFVLSYRKNVTFLEACQFLKTLQFVVRISYVDYLLGTQIHDEKILFLGFENEK